MIGAFAIKIQQFSGGYSIFMEKYVVISAS